MAKAEARLPSRGKLNPELGGAEEVTIRSMKTPEEKVMYSDRRPMEKILHIVRACLETDGLKVEDLAVPDALQLFFEIRGISLPQHRNYDMPARCSECSQQFRHTVMIPEGFQVKYAADDMSEPFSVKLPDCGKTLELRHFRIKDATAVEKKVNRAMRQIGTGVDPEEVAFPMRVAKQIVSVDGEKPKGGEYQLIAFVESLEYQDSLALSHTLDDNDFGPSLILELECPRCKWVDDHRMRLKADFFRPKSRKRGSPQRPRESADS